ncbi:hypothetical protein GD1_25 [Paraglaciecola Antarctic GD virus 1]|nr:hypothetical protein GD1_25 [Paraglaciecola Antarctic GD virus 1]
MNIDVKIAMQKKLARLLGYGIFKDSDGDVIVETPDEITIFNPLVNWNQLMPLVKKYGLVHNYSKPNYQASVQGLHYHFNVYAVDESLAVAYVECLIKLLSKK